MNVASGVLPENTNTHPKKGCRKFQGGGRSQKPKCLNESVNQNWNFQREGEFKSKSLSRRGMDYYFQQQQHLTQSKVQ